jgi:outer membrane lipoprotein carrier protein
VRSLALLLALWLSPAAVAESPLLTLQGLLANMESLSGNFTQQVFSSDSDLLETSSGAFALLRPGYFMWHIKMPDEQLLMAGFDGLWHYDVELETATRRPMPADDSASPLAVLGGDSSVLGEHYVVEQIAPSEFRLLPIAQRNDFTVLELRFEDGLPVAMQVQDPLQRSTTILFTQLQRNPSLFPSDFEFDPPTGVDIYYND